MKKPEKGDRVTIIQEGVLWHTWYVDGVQYTQVLLDTGEFVTVLAPYVYTAACTVVEDE